MSAYDTFLTYQAIKLHFTSESYDYVKFNGKYKCSIERFESRKDRFQFHKLDRRYPIKDDLVLFLAANFFAGEAKWVGELLTEEADDVYKLRRKVKESLEYSVRQDLDLLGILNREDLKRNIQVTNGEYPTLLKSIMVDKMVYPETWIALDALIHFTPMWDRRITDTVLYPAFSHRVRRYAPFLRIDVKNLSHSLRKHLANG